MTAERPQATAAPANPPRARIIRPFPDFAFMASPQDYKGPVFRLSQNFPSTKPAAAPAFMKTDFQADWKRYMLEVRDYCLAGNTESDWRVENNTVRKWYHMPFQHWGPHAREGVHGLTMEAPIGEQQLAHEQTYKGQAFAVGIYNDIAGYTLGQIWNRDDPAADFTGVEFADGATVCKPLFVDLGPGPFAAQVPSLINPVLWDAYIAGLTPDHARVVRHVALLQLDILVRDSRSPVGWVMGTFQYNGALNNTNRWLNLVPVGLMWGNDASITDDKDSNPLPETTVINHALKQTVINDSKDLPATHLGWNGRLDGPLDNARSSCISCHMTAEFPAVSLPSPLFGPLVVKYADVKNLGDAQWMRWFQTPKSGTAFDSTNPQDPTRLPRSTDFILQLAAALQAFEDWQYQDGEFATDWLPGQAADPKPHLKGHAPEVLRNVPTPNR